MKLSAIASLLTSKIIVETFKEQNKAEFESFSVLQSKRGSTIPIYLNEDIQVFEFNYLHLVELCILYIEESLSSSELSYIADALLLSEKVDFVDDSIINVIEVMTDPSINGEFTKENAQEIVDRYQ